jgi:2-polyprenyl-3-methyl-5-hydroxy-6-metoxy-1,4-benzoquinol methylase
MDRVAATAPQDAFVRWAALQAWSTDATNRFDEQTDLAFWDQAAATYDQHALAVRVPRVLERVRALIRPGATLLEVGAGTGAFSVPLAATASFVTALDYSPAMLGVLEHKLKLAGSNSARRNVRPLLARWEDAGVEPHSVVLAANALYRTADLRLALDKMVRLARERGIIVWSVGRRTARQRALHPEVEEVEGYRPGPDYIHVLDGLFDLDVFAQVEMIRVDASPVAVIWWDSR